MDLKVENGGAYKEEKLRSWGKSLPVPSVQEIVRNGNLQSIPERYMHENEESPIPVNLPDSELEIPVIDFSLLAKGDKDELKKLDFALKEWGFFHVENAGAYKEEKLGFWGKSLPVPSVQEIVRNGNLQSIPERYIQENEESPIPVNLPDSELEIPVIDFSLLAKGDKDELKKLDFALKEWGFFHMINHGIREEVLHKMKEAVSSFFELPLEEKKKYAKQENETQGYGQSFVFSEHQKLEWADMLYLITSPPENRNSKFWPLSLPGFKEAMDEYSIEMQKIVEELNANFSVLMGLDRNGLKRLQGELNQGIKMNYYPVCPRPDLVLGAKPHSDATTFTLVQQDDDVTGLEIRHKDAWIPVKPMQNSFVVNVGDATEIQSNGMYKSIEHRVMTNKEKPRKSIVTFLFPDYEQEIGPLESMINDSHRPRMYRNIKFGEYIRELFARKMEGKALLDFVKLQSK